MGDIGWPEILIVILVLVVLFGAKKLPELARGSGRAIRIFKAETKGLMDDDDDDVQPTVKPSPLLTTEVVQPQATDPGQHAAPAAQPLPPTNRDS